MDLFDGLPKHKKETDYLTVMPVSVIEISAQKKREKENHATTSSRQNYSPFPEEVARLCYEFYLKECDFVFDPFAGWGERGHYANLYGKNYIGYDTSQEAIQKAKTDFGVENVLEDSLSGIIPPFDGVLTCPPYWDLEKYAGDGIDKRKTWEQFLSDYADIWGRIYEQSAPGATFCVMVGEWRKNHKLYDLEYQTRKIFDYLDAVLFDQVVISRRTISKIKIMLPQAKRLGYSVRVHESLLIFKKPA